MNETLLNQHKKEILNLALELFKEEQQRQALMLKLMKNIINRLLLNNNLFINI